MPTYQYVCSKCDHKFEVVQSMADEPLASCPKGECPRKPWGRGLVRRTISGGAGLIFKGSGFYTTDYRSEAYKQAAKKESESAAPKKETPASTKSEPKPATPKSET